MVPNAPGTCLPLPPQVSQPYLLSLPSQLQGQRLRAHPQDTHLTSEPKGPERSSSVALLNR